MSATASKRCGWRGTISSSGRGASSAAQHCSKGISSPSRVTAASTTGRASSWRHCSPRASSSGSGVEVELQVAADLHPLGADAAQPPCIGLGLRQHRAPACAATGRTSARDALALGLALVAQPCIGQHHRHAARRAPRAAGSARSRFPSARPPRGGGGAGSGAPRPACPRAASTAHRRRAAAPRRLRARWRCHASAADACPGRCARSASTNAAAARVSPSDTACSHSAPGRAAR